MAPVTQAQINQLIALWASKDAGTTDVAGSLGALSSSLTLNDQAVLRFSINLIEITGNTTLSSIHNGSVLEVTAASDITVPTGLPTGFSCVIRKAADAVVTITADVGATLVSAALTVTSGVATMGDEWTQTALADTTTDNTYHLA